MDTWLFIFMKVTSTCRGVLDRERSRCSSVSCLTGIRFRIQICKGAHVLMQGAVLVHDENIFIVQNILAEDRSVF